MSFMRLLENFLDVFYEITRKFLELFSQPQLPVIVMFHSTRILWKLWFRWFSRGNLRPFMLTCSLYMWWEVVRICVLLKLAILNIQYPCNSKNQQQQIMQHARRSSGFVFSELQYLHVKWNYMVYKSPLANMHSLKSLIYEISCSE